MKINSHEWNQTAHQLAAMFNQPAAPKGSAFARNKGLQSAAQRSAAAADDYETVPIGKLSPLQEDEQRYYVTAVIQKTKDRLKLATVTWHKEHFESWRTRAENRLPTSLTAPSRKYEVPQVPHGGCVNNTWTATDGPPDGRYGHTAVWTGSEMIVWGGYYYDGNDHYLNSGGRYNPSTDSWVATSTTNAPSARASHKAVWTGTEMILWGGGDGVNYLNTGGKYNAGTNSWMSVSTTGAPSARTSHTATWNGNEMIIWGGYFFDGTDHYLNTGARYSPTTNGWTPVSITNVPDGRALHTAVWTGSDMIVWGGEGDFDLGYYFNTGGRYNPATDSWTATSTINAPDGRYRHTGVWTGNEMIVWGGILYSNTYTSTGGRYCALSGPTPTPSPSPTPTPCTGRCEPTPRPRPTPHVRPTPR